MLRYTNVTNGEDVRTRARRAGAGAGAGREKPRALAPEHIDRTGNRGGDAALHIVAASTIQRVINNNKFSFWKSAQRSDFRLWTTLGNIYDGRPCSISVDECGYDEHEGPGNHPLVRSQLNMRRAADERHRRAAQHSVQRTRKGTQRITHAGRRLVLC